MIQKVLAVCVFFTNFALENKNCVKMENNIRKWIYEMEEGTYALSELVVSYAQWCERNGVEARMVTSQKISRTLVALGYERKRWGIGLVFVIK